MNLTDHDNTPPGAMPEPTRAQQAEYYRLYAEIEAERISMMLGQYAPNSRLVHAEVVKRMGLNKIKEIL